MSLWKNRYRIGVVLSSLFFWTWGVWAAPPESEDLFRRRSQDRLSFAEERYMLYPNYQSERAIYDRLGNFVTYGPSTWSVMFRWDEIRDKYADDKLEAGYDISMMPSTSGLLDALKFAPFRNMGVVISSHSVEDRSASFMIGRRVLTTFSPLTFYQTGFSGVRTDFSVPHHEGTLLLSRGGLYGHALFSEFAGSEYLGGRVLLSPVLLYGLNWRTHYGPVNVGATFLKQLQSSPKGDRRSLFRGDVPYPELKSPKIIVVRVTDDSPYDRPGAVVYGGRISIRSKPLTEGAPPVWYSSSREEIREDARYDPSLSPDITGRPVGEYWGAQGEETVDLTFNLPPNIAPDLVEIAVSVSGDYRIGMRQIYDFVKPGTDTSEERTWPGTPNPSRQNVDFKDNPYEEEPFFTIVRAEGNPLPSDAPKTVRFRHVIPTAQSFYGLNFTIQSVGFSAKGEWVWNPKDFMFPVKEGAREHKTSSAGFLQAKKRLGDFGRLGVEGWRLDPTYGGWYDSRRGGLVLFTDVGGDAGVGEEVANRASTQEFPIYDDNDDHDRWPDDRSVERTYVPRGAFESPERIGGRPESGVYPGWDMDGDRVIDYDRNVNGIGDWMEPFLNYDIDPPEFVYGMDFNNNGVPDFREDDFEADYPYPRDQEGVHLFFDVGRRPVWMDRLAVGWYRTRQIAGGGRSTASYVRLTTHATFGGLAFRLSWDGKRVKDDISDNVYRYVITTDSHLIRRMATNEFPPPLDLLMMRNSWVSTAFLSAHYQPLRSLAVENNVKSEVNWRGRLDNRLGEEIQGAETLPQFFMVNKVGYSPGVRWPVDVTFRLKHLLVRKKAGSYVPMDSLRTGPDVSWSLVTPTIVISYPLTSKTRIELGQHGLFLPALQARYVDRVDHSMGYRDNLTVLQLTMSGVHQGYRIVANVGTRWRRTTYKTSSGSPDEHFSAFFVDMVMGLE
ncbi:MAG: hypothetical protein KAJ81_07750 [Candidatus Latescibacteria bacterium]|nr:hypothetical protein [Candidatus Latescibacterota bacterium]